MEQHQTILNHLGMIFTQEELSRIQIFSSAAIKIIVDVHGLCCKQARRFLNNIINCVRLSYELIVVHGYSHGTAIKKMMAEPCD
ncbi:hypothetical protein SAMN02910400_00612 [Lachnospiraceae bacterium C10]|nr:hypothetical protein SAMN02910400_00612 [Lachnospiraceae bacterium C10]